MYLVQSKYKLIKIVFNKVVNKTFKFKNFYFIQI